MGLVQFGEQGPPGVSSLGGADLPATPGTIGQVLARVAGLGPARLPATAWVTIAGGGAFGGVSVPIVAGDVLLTGPQSVADLISLTGTPAGSFTVTLDAAAARDPGVPIKVRNLTGHDQYFADRNGSVWIIAPGSTLLLEWITGANPTLNAVSVQAVGGVLVDSGSIPAAGRVLASDGGGNGGWRDPAPLAWTWASLAVTDAVNTPGAPANACAVLRCTGAIVADHDLVLPLVRRAVIITNATTGGHNVNVRGATGTGALCPPGLSIAFCDGVNFTLTP